MKIYDSERKQILESITLYLTPNEADDLANNAKELSENPHKHHSHINDKNFKNEIIISVYTKEISVYTKENINQFDEESKKVIGNELE